MDAPGKFLGVKRWFPLRLPQHISSVLVDFERLLSSSSLSQQDHEVAEYILVCWPLRQKGEEEFFGPAYALLFQVEFYQFVQHTVPRPVDHLSSSLRPLAAQIVFEKLTLCQSVCCLQKRKWVLPLALSPNCLCR